MKKIKKGQYGYLNHQKKVELVKTFLLFTLAFSVFLIGYTTTGKKENILTVISILVMLPACRNAVTLIMFLRYSSGDAEQMKQIQERAGIGNTYFDAVLTTSSKSFSVDSFVCIKGNLIGYSCKRNTDCKAIEKHVKDMTVNNGIKNVTVKIFTDFKKYRNRVDELVKLIDADEKSEHRNIETNVETNVETNLETDVETDVDTATETSTETIQDTGAETNVETTTEADTEGETNDKVSKEERVLTLISQLSL